MTKHKKESYFWTSYSDLMTSLFFIMLVLFILVVILLYNRIKDIEELKGNIRATEEQLSKIKEIEEATNKINPHYFEYRKEYKKHILKTKVNFQKGQSDIGNIDTTTQEKLVIAGKEIEKSIKDITKTYPFIQYLLIIEGQASRDKFDRNFELSYERALALKRFWEEKGIDFGKNCEVLISGSGTEGAMREERETDNQRFLIHIIPKPGIIEASNINE